MDYVGKHFLAHITLWWHCQGHRCSLCPNWSLAALGLTRNTCCWVGGGWRKTGPIKVIPSVCIEPSGHILKCVRSECCPIHSRASLVKITPSCCLCHLMIPHLSGRREKVIWWTETRKIWPSYHARNCLNVCWHYSRE